ncbi:MAG: glycosyltransferase family 2 protein [Endomicrobium sp.]|jgi:glycosyltransferase involved in cell wall biosynthesis|nr:glycosyltransferase family 2 protein [Endomicrobium sp.]
MKLSIVSPIYNEGSLVNTFVEAISKIVATMGISYEILLVDDGSTDDTWKYINALSDRENKIRGIRFSRNFGKECALIAGIENANGETVITIDSDLQHPIELIPQMYEMWAQGETNIIECVKEQRQKESFLNRCFAKFYYVMFHKLTGIDLKNASDFKLFDRAAINAMNKLIEKEVFFRGISKWVGFNRRIIHFTPNDRKENLSKWSFAKKINLAVGSLTSYTAKPLIFILIMTFCFFCLSVIMGIEVIVRYITKSSASGFPTVILLICVVGTAILLSLTLLAIYINQIFNEVKARPRYIISDICGQSIK